MAEQKKTTTKSTAAKKPAAKTTSTAKKPAAKKSNGGVKKAEASVMNAGKKIDGEFEKLSKAAPATGKKSPKSWFVTLMLVIFLGDFGAHRFYTGKIWTGIIQLCLCWSFVWWIIDLVKVATGHFRDKKGNTVEK